jgi:hypothetical protein
MKKVKQLSFDICIDEEIDMEQIKNEIIKRMNDLKKITLISDIEIEDLTHIYIEQGYTY